MAVTLTQIQDYVKGKGYDSQIQEDTDQVYATYTVEDVSFPFFFRIYEGNELVQLIFFLPLEVQEKTAGHLARLLHLFNKELDIPGFGMDEISKIIFYRCMIPTVKGELDHDVMDSYMRAAEFACKSFTPPIDSIISGQATFDEILEQAKKATRSEIG